MKVISRATLSNDELYRVIYLPNKGVVMVEIGGITLKLSARKFVLMNEMMRKAVARLVMQTDITKGSM